MARSRAELSAWALRKTAGIWQVSGSFSQFVRNLPAVQSRQDRVQEDQVRLPRTREFESNQALGCLDHFEPGQFEVNADDEPDRRLVFDQQDPCHYPTPERTRSCRSSQHDA